MTQPPNGLFVRVAELERRVGDLETTQPAVLAERVANLGDWMRSLSSDVRALRRAVLGAALTIAGSAVIYALSIALLS